MNWKNMDIKELWGLIVATIQALASFGIAIIALIGLWKVSPIIVYQVEQQEKASEVSSPSESPSQTPKYRTNSLRMFLRGGPRTCKITKRS